MIKFTKICEISFVLPLFLTSSIASATSIDFKNIQFREGSPAAGGLSKSTDLSVSELDKLIDDNISIFNDGALGLITIVGFTDSKECKVYECVRLSCDRAEAVYHYMVKRGLRLDIVEKLICMGRRNPVASDETDAGRQLNRRVEFIFDAK